MILNVDPQLSQWDVDRIVVVSDTEATHMHFANPGDSKAVIMEIVGGEVQIPNYLLQTGKNLIAYAVLDGVTVGSKTFPVRKRERPENYVYEEDRRNYIYELIADTENAAARANEAADRMNAHVDDSENPHRVTPEQIGAVSSEDYDTLVDDVTRHIMSVEDVVTAHSDRDDNPHGVTAAQVGAVAEEEFAGKVETIIANDYSDGGPISQEVLYPLVDEEIYQVGTEMLYEAGVYRYDEESGEEIAHAYDTNNPHNVTCEQIGAVSVEKYESYCSDTALLLEDYDNHIGEHIADINHLYEVTSAHTKDKNNPHGTTAAQLGAVSLSDFDNKLRYLNGNFSPEWEIGSVTVTDNALVYLNSKYIVRTKEGQTYWVPAGTTFALSDYTYAFLVVFYSCDNGATYVSRTIRAASFTVESDAVVIMRIQHRASATQTDTTLAELLEVDVPNIKAAVTEMQPLVKEDLNDATLWEMGNVKADGSLGNDTIKARTKDYLSDAVELVYAEKDYVFFVALYKEGTFVGWWNGKEVVIKPEEITDEYTGKITFVRYFNPKGLTGYKCRLMCAQYNSDTISVAECCNIHFLNGTQKKIFHPQPTLTFIDDDGIAEALDNWEEIADEIGVKNTFALTTSGISNPSTPKCATWEQVERLQNRGFEFISHTHNHFVVGNTVPDTAGYKSDEDCVEDFNATISALREHGCESRYLVYPTNTISDKRIQLVRKYFVAGIGGEQEDNCLPIYTYWLKRYSINNGDVLVKKEYNGETVSVYSFKSLDTLKSHIDKAIINGSWVIIMTHFRNDEHFYYNKDIKQMVIDLCRYAVEKGMTIQTFGQAFERYKNIMDSGSIYANPHYFVDCNGVVHYRGQEE